MRVLITGASGFAGGWLAQACTAAGDSVFGLSRRGEVPSGGGEAVAVDLVDAGAVRAALAEVAPDVIYHLAALSSVGRSWEQPGRTMSENLGAAVSLLEAIRAQTPRARIVWVSSCEVYGAADELPVPETAIPRPANPYAVSKLAAEQLAGVYAEAYGLNLVAARPFSHTGPRQLANYIVSNLSRQAAQARLDGADSLQIVTGNPETRRDFTDVRDVAQAYRALAACDATGVYNVSTGHSVSAAEQVALIAELVAPIHVEHVVDPDRIRPHEVMDMRGANQRLTEDTGWRPSIPLRQTVADTIDWWERELSAAPTPQS